jgi:hypothetical protein
MRHVPPQAFQQLGCPVGNPPYHLYGPPWLAGLGLHRWYTYLVYPQHIPTSSTFFPRNKNMERASYLVRPCTGLFSKRGKDPGLCIKVMHTAILIKTLLQSIYYSSRISQSGDMNQPLKNTT